MEKLVSRARPYTCLTIVVAMLGVAAAPQGSAERTALVTVIAEPQRAITNLSARDFIVHEDKSTREVVNAELASAPLFISLMVDTTQPPLGVLAATRDIRAALSSFVKTIQSARPDSQIALREFAGASVSVVDYTTNGAELDKHIQRLNPDQRSGAVLLEALIDASRSLSDKPGPRRAIVSLDFTSPEGSSDNILRKVAEEVQKSGATVWAVSVGTGSSQTREAVLNAVTKGSGGLRLTTLDVSALESLMKSVANSLLSQYQITFVRQGNVNVKALRFETARGGKVLLTPWMR